MQHGVDHRTESTGSSGDAASIAAPRARSTDGPLAATAVTVVVCAYTEERWGDLLAAVSSVQEQSLRPLETLVVVDHNPRLLARLRDELAGLPEVQVLANAEARGLSGGRNTGVAAARGDIVAFLDDDAVAERDWLRWLVAGYADPQVMGVGGFTLPVWASAGRPSWFPEEFDWVHGASYRGMPSGQARVRNVLGGNASFRRTAFDIAGGFQTGIGRGAGEHPLGCEETELCIRIQQRCPGSAFLFDDRAVIHHRVPPERERFAYFRERCWAEGLSKAQVARFVGAGDGLAAERRYVTRTLPAGLLRALGDALRGRESGARRAGAIAAGVLIAAAGYAVGSRSQLRARRAAAHRTDVDGAAAGHRSSARDGGICRAAVRRANVRRGKQLMSGDRKPAEVPVLMYHAVSDEPSDAALPLSVRPDVFAAQLELLDSLGFTPVALGTLIAAWRAAGSGRVPAVPLPNRPVVLTFDDGYADFHREVLPILQRTEAPATLFVTTGWIEDAGAEDAGGRLDTMLTWKQLTDIADSGVEIGGHSHSHPQLDRLADRHLAHEVTHCKELLDEHFGRPTTVFAYPFGYSSDRVRRAVRAAGYSGACAVANTLASPRQSPYALGRLTVHRNTSLAAFEEMVQGRSIRRIFLKDRMLTKGYALVRRSWYGLDRALGRV